MATPLHRRILRGLRWALFGRPPQSGVGRLTGPTTLFIEATVTSSEEVATLTGEPAAWVRIQLLEHVGPEHLAEGLLVNVRGAGGPGVVLRQVGHIVRGGDLELETAHGEHLVLQSRTFTIPRAPGDPAFELKRNLPHETGGIWPGEQNDGRCVRESVLRRGDVIRFEARFVPERHPRSGESYRGEVDVRYRVEPVKNTIELLLVPRPE